MTGVPGCPGNNAIRISFKHGLGECVDFAHLIPLYTRRGYSVEVECPPDNAIVFRAAGANVVEAGATIEHPWNYPFEGIHEGHGRFWQGTTFAQNIVAATMPAIGDPADLWQEYCNVRLDIKPLLPTQLLHTVDRWLRNLPRPIVLLHSIESTPQGKLSLPNGVVTALCKELLDRCDGSLILLDWDHCVPMVSAYRVRQLHNLGRCPLDTLLALYCQADLLIGVDGGPFRAARLTQMKKLGVWMPGRYPATYSVPCREQVNVVLADATRQWNRFKRIPWNIVEHEGSSFVPSRLAHVSQQMLEGPRYLRPEDIAADIQLRQFVLEWCHSRHARPAADNVLSTYIDRHKSFDVLLREMRQRFDHAIVVETGTIRTVEDWNGAGFFTYLMGAYLARKGGKLFSVDINAVHCSFAREWTAVFGDTVHVVQQDSVSYLTDFGRAIDVLYIDSLDTSEPGHADHALYEVQAALPHLHECSMIVFDDTPWHGKWMGKGAIAVPWLMNRGWKLLYGGHQVVLSKE